ncbi:MAG: GAF domain-containing sensor histidine kinase [Candidatus Nanopelagicales bacterium]
MTDALASRRVREGVTRGLGILAVILLAAITGDLSTSGQQIVLLIVIAITASIPQRPPWLRYATILAEAAAAALVVIGAPLGDRPSIAYLAVPPIVAAYSMGLAGVLAAAAVSALVLIVGSVIRFRSELPTTVVDLTIWLCIAIALGLGAVLARHLRERMAPPRTDYDAARRLLTSLRDVARQLPGGLEETALAEAALTRLGDVLPHERAEVFVRSDGGTLLPVARMPEASEGWSPTVHAGLWGQAWENGVAVQRLGTMTGPELGTSTACAVIPLRLGDQRIGLVGVERAGGLWPIEDLAEAQLMADEAALRIDTARLFEEVRDLATLEERRRLAREIHDGIAQEVAGLGFLVDDALREAQDEPTRRGLQRLREELTRIVTELRLSIYDLRTEVGAGIGEALSTHVRAVGAEAGMTVHLVLDEDASRLPPGVAPEILRIAQEAVANARRHAQARTLWVTYRVTDGSAFLRVADDGRGIPEGRRRPDSFGLQIMRERADRIGAGLTVKRRSPSGTVVELSLQVPEAGTGGER